MVGKPLEKNCHHVLVADPMIWSVYPRVVFLISPIKSQPAIRGKNSVIASPESIERYSLPHQTIPFLLTVQR